MKRMIRLLLPFLGCVVATVRAASGQLAPPAMGELPALTFKTEQEPSNLLTSSLAFVTSYDDNVSLNNANRVGDVSYEIKPRISFALSRKRLTWASSFSPGLTIHQHLVQRDLLTNAFGSDFQYKLTKHLSARFRGSFVIQTNPLSDTGAGDSSTPTFSLLDQPNDFVITPQVRRVSEQADMGFTYQLDKRTTVQASGNFYNLRFNNIGADTGPGLTNSQAASGRALYSHRLSRRHSGGLIYNFQDLATFGGHPGRTVSHSFLYSHSIEFTPSTTLEAFAGPEHARTDEILVLPILGGSILIPVTTSSWSWAAGTTLGWQGDRSSVRATFRHQVQNGGGLPTAARHTSGTLELRRRLFAGWLSSVSVGYGENKLLTLQSKSSTQSFAASAGLRHKLGRDIWLDFRYSRGHQRGSGELINRSGDVDRVTVSLEYQFKHALGR
jgi:hypothetical protein